MTWANALRWAGWVIVVAIVHFAAVRAGILLDVWPRDGDTVWLPFWLPAGTALASLLLLGWRYWPGVLIGSMAGDVSLDVPVATALVLGVANTAEAVVSTVLARRLVGTRHLMATTRGFARMFLIVVFSASCVSAPLGVWAMVEAGFVDASTFWRHWWLWSSGNVIGVMVAAPAPLALLRRRWRETDFGSPLEAFVVVVLAGVSALVVHMGLGFPEIQAYPVAFVMVPFLIWVAFRFGPEGTSMLIPVLSIIAAVGTAAGVSPFKQDTAFETLVLVQSYVGVSALSAYLLSALVSDRKSSERALQKAKEEAERASRAKSDFLASMSHELRTPLNAIIGFSETIERETFGPSGNPRYCEYAAHIHEAGMHLLTLINGLLDLYKVESRGTEVRRRTVRVSAIVDEISAAGEVLAKNNGNAFVCTADDDLGDALLDPTLTRQILLNLIGNAAKFTEGGEISLSVRSLNDGTELEFRVADTGPGMSEEDTARVFEPFHRGSPMLVNEREGAGLGLAIAAEVCRALDGRIDVESQPDKGTAFTVHLPSV